jgi:uncharacterized RDD family membrane protein YckC
MPSESALNCENKHKFNSANLTLLLQLIGDFFSGTLVASVNRLDRVDKTLDRNHRLTSLSVIRKKPFWIPLDIRVWQNAKIKKNITLLVTQIFKKQQVLGSLVLACVVYRRVMFIALFAFSLYNTSYM